MIKVRPERAPLILIVSTSLAIVGVALAAWGAPFLAFLPFFGCYFGRC